MAPLGALPPRVTAAQIEAYIGQLGGPSGEASVAVAPFTGQPLPAIPTFTAAEVHHAAERARLAQPEWASLALKERTSRLLEFAAAIVDQEDHLLDLMQWETGKSRIHAAIELLGVGAVAQHYASRGAKYLRKRSLAGAVPGLVRTQVVRHPKGVVGVIAPWNYPLFLAVGDVIPALLAGNAVISKADSQAPLTLLAARHLALQAGIPADVWQVVTGRGSVVGPALIAEVDHLAFTGSTATGRQLAAAAGERLISSSMELGGKNAMIVRADANLKAAVTGGIQAVYASAGQMCIGVERIYVQRRLYRQFVHQFADAANELSLGSSYDLAYEVGSLTSAEQLETTTTHVEDALGKGATLVAGGRPRPELGPYFFEPTVLTDVTEKMTLFAEETFGPVVAIYPYDTDAEAVAAANASQYGLSASIWSRDLAAARALAGQIEAGAVNINDGYLAAISALGAPMGGMKTSGVGRRHGPDGIWRYTEQQTVTSQRVATPYPKNFASYLASLRVIVHAQMKMARVKLRERRK